MKSVAAGIERRPPKSRGQLRILVATIVVTVTACFAGHWEIEQVDVGSLGSYVAIDKTSDGTIWLAYVNSDSAIRLAHKDSEWEYEDLDTAMVRPGFPSWQTWPPFSFDVGPGDVIGAVGLARLAEHRDSVWSSEALPVPMSDAFLSYDLGGRPSLTFRDSMWSVCLALKPDSSWDTNVLYVPTQGEGSSFSFTRPSWRQHGNCAFMREASWGTLIQEYEVGLYRRDSGIWTERGLAGGLDGSGNVFAALPDSTDSIHTLWSAWDNYFTYKLVCDDESLDVATGVAAACLDDSGRVQCAWVRDDVLKFVLLHEPTLIVGSGGGIGWCDITTDALSQPVIAYCTGDGSIYLAHGVDIAGLNAGPQSAALDLSGPGATIVRGVLMLGGLGTRSELPERNSVMSRAVLLDISGRKVMDLHPGANDVSRLGPGVYFAREGAGGRELEGTAGRKVVIAK